jgi:hypothetical protein
VAGLIELTLVFGSVMALAVASLVGTIRAQRRDAEREARERRDPSEADEVS